MGCDQSKSLAIIEAAKTLSTHSCATISINSLGDESFSSELHTISDHGEQLHQLLKTSLDNSVVKNDCDNSQLWARVIKICDIDPNAAAYTEQESFQTPLHLACRILERSTPSASKDRLTASPADAIRVLIQCCAESVSKTDIDGYIPLHYIIPHSCRPNILYQQQPHQQNPQFNHIQNQVIVLNLLISADYDSSMKYLSRSDVKFSSTDRACTPLYHAVSAIQDDFFQHSCPTVDLISTIHLACPGMVSVKNKDNRDTPLTQLYRRFSRQLNLSEKCSLGSHSRKEVLEHQLRYKTSAINTWKIILNLLLPTDSVEEKEWKGRKQQQRRRNASDLYVLHSAVKMNCPPDLIKYIIKTRPDEVSKTDENGHLPLHIAATTTPLNSSSDDNEAGNYQSKLIIEEILSAFPEGATRVNRDGKLPLQLAIESGKFWNRGGVKSLYEVFPEAMANAMVEEHTEIHKDDDFISLTTWQNCISN